MAFENGEIDPVKYGVLWQKVQAMAALLGLGEADLDALFIYANGVQV